MRKQFNDHVAVLEGKEKQDLWLPDNSSVQDDVRELERQPVHAEEQEQSLNKINRQAVVSKPLENQKVKEFDRDAVLKSIRKSALCGRKSDRFNASKWQPPLQRMSSLVLHSLRLKRIEWSMKDGIICSLQLELSNGSVSSIVGLK